MGRPTKLTADIQQKIVSALTAGNYQETAAAYAGVARATFYNWLARGQAERDSIAAGGKPNKSEAAYAEFLDAVESARAQAEIRSVALIQKAANDGTWQAAAWYLERSHPQKWGRLNRTEISGPDGGPIETVDIDALDAKLVALFDRIDPDR